MELTPDMLDAYLRILRDNGVVEFLGQGFHVRFTPVISEAPVVPHQHEDGKPSRSMWENEALWPGGEPPTFHKK